MTKHLLLAEDNPVFSAQMSQAIEKLPNTWSIFPCDTGKKALEALRGRKKSFDLALIDIGLPDIDGVHIIKACRQKFPQMPIVVISVIAAEKTVLSAIQAGANGYILKHDPIDQIALGIRQVMEGIYPLSPALARILFAKLSDEAAIKASRSDIKLTPRELETLGHLSKGHSYEGVATLMNVSLSTIQWNVRRIYKKLNVHSQTQAINKAREFNLL